jgi:hypothetical protein
MGGSSSSLKESVSVGLVLANRIGGQHRICHVGDKSVCFVAVDVGVSASRTPARIGTLKPSWLFFPWVVIPTVTNNDPL